MTEKHELKELELLQLYGQLHHQHLELDQLKHQFRQKRGGGQVRGDSVFIENLSGEERAAIDQVVGSEPTPEFAAQLTEECERLLSQLDDETLRTVAVAKMEGYSNDEIAERLGVKTRTVERKLNLIREIWSQPQP